MEQQFSLSWNNFHGNLTKGFAGLLGKGEFVDVTIAVDGHLLQAHKVILSICSPYFKKMFQMNPCQHPIVVLRDVTLKAMKDLLQFMYHGEVSVMQEDLTNFIGTAEVLQIKGLTNKESEDDEIKEKNPKQLKENITRTSNGESSLSDSIDPHITEDTMQNEELRVKRRELLERLLQYRTLKRDHDSSLPDNDYSNLHATDKRQKIKEKPMYTKQNNLILASNYENLRGVYDENPIDITKSLNTHSQKICVANKEKNDKNKEQIDDSSLDLKTEYDDSDIIVTDPAVCTTPKSYNGSGDSQKDLPLPLDYHSPQDNCTSLNSLFLDLKNLVNGKMCNNMRSNICDEYPRHTADHRLVTIPQKEDGKKKYPQRSCRLCWKIGRRRDTRFMCNACELPFCKSPCFEVHYNDILKVNQLQADYYAN